MNYKMDKHEEALIEKYGFVVSEQGDRFVVTDKQMPRGKQKYIGGNLYSLMLQAINERSLAKQKLVGGTPKAKITDWRKLRDRPEAEIVPMPPPKPKPGPKQGTLYTIKKLLIEQPNLTYDQIVSKLQQAGIEASESSIKTCRSDFRHSIRVIKELGRWREC